MVVSLGAGMVACAGGQAGVNEVNFMTEVGVTINTRIGKNQDLADKLKQAGLLTEQQHKDVTKTLENTKDKITKMQNDVQSGTSMEIMENLEGSAVGYFTDPHFRLDYIDRVNTTRKVIVNSDGSPEVVYTGVKYFTGSFVDNTQQNADGPVQDYDFVQYIFGSPATTINEYGPRWERNSRLNREGVNDTDVLFPQSSEEAVAAGYRYSDDTWVWRDNGTGIMAEGDTAPVPFKIMEDDSHADEINSKINYELWVLKDREYIRNGIYEAIRGNGPVDPNNMVTLETLYFGIDQVINGATDTERLEGQAIMDKFFQPSGENLFIWHRSLEDPGPPGASEEQKGENCPGGCGLHNPPVGESIDMRVAARDPKVKRKSNAPGIDLKFSQALVHDDNDDDNLAAPPRRDIMQIRFFEFNENTVNLLLETIGNAGSKVMVIGNKAYLMEYPVYYMSEVKIAPATTGVAANSSYTTEWEKSNLLINLRDKQLKTTDGSTSTTISQMPAEYDYISLGQSDASGNLNPFAEGRSSFFVIDNEILTLINGKNVWAGAIGLRDYLEFSYVPNTVENEKLIAAGRKIRLHNYKGTLTSIFASYRDEFHTALPDTPSLHAYDFGDIPKLQEENVLHRLTDGTMTEGQVQEGTDTSSIATGGSYMGRNNISDLSVYIVDKVEPTARFPSNIVGRVDNTADILRKDRIIFYGAFIHKSPFETAFFNGWISRNDSTTKSLNWWSRWLMDNGFAYRLSPGDIESQFASDYEYEMAKDGYVILDLETINKIREDYEAEDARGTVRWIRTTFIIIGIFLVLMATMLMLAWTFDTSLDVGAGLLRKMSLGHWVAVKDSTELPLFDDEEYQYVGLGKMIQISGIVALIGIVLITVDIVQILSFFVDIFGKAAEVIERRFFSFR
jgi:hypothetical protein